MKQKSSLVPDIIYEILLNLHVESLLRCKSVCKQWYSLISDQHFIKSHLTLSTNNLKYTHHTLILYTVEFIPHPSLDIYEIGRCFKICPLSDFMFHKSYENALELENPLQRTRPPRSIQIVGSCNGLVCLLVQNDDYDLFIYNPATRIWNEIPLYRRRRQHDYYSFGYDQSSDDYKIVELVITSSDIIQGLIYSLETGKWKNIGDFSYAYPYHACGVFSNGAIHWVAYSDSPRRTETIVSLDLATETFGEVLQPVYDEGIKYLSLGVLGECLCGFCYYHQSHADLWVMKVYGVKDSWTKLASFPLLDWLGNYPVPLFISNDGKILFQREYKSLVIYDSKDGSESLHAEACIVVESLVSPFSRLGLAEHKGSCRKKKSRGKRRVWR